MPRWGERMDLIDAELDRREAESWKESYRRAAISANVGFSPGGVAVLHECVAVDVSVRRGLSQGMARGYHTGAVTVRHPGYGVRRVSAHGAP